MNRSPWLLCGLLLASHAFAQPKIHDVGTGLKLDGELKAGMALVAYQVRLLADKAYQIDLRSPRPDLLDPFLKLFDDKGQELASDDDGGGGLNARIAFQCVTAGVYRIEASAFGNGAGAFTLEVREGDPADALESLARMQAAKGDWGGLHASRAKILQLRAKQHPKDDWRVTDARVAVADAELWLKLSADQRRALSAVNEQSSEPGQLMMQGRFAEAVELARKNLDLRKELQGREHPQFFAGSIELAQIYHRLKAYQKAEPLYRDALELQKKVLGDNHPDYGQALNSLAVLLRYVGKYEESEQFFVQSLAILKAALGEENDPYATALTNATNLYSDLGQHEKALALGTQAVEITKRVMGVESFDYSIVLNNLAMALRDAKQFAKAEPLFQQAVEINRKILRPNHPDLAHSIHNLAANTFDQGRIAEAEPLFLKALGIIADHLETSAATLSEAEQLNEARQVKFYLDSTLVGTAQGDAAKSYDVIMRSRGAVTARQTMTRAARSSDPAVRKVLEQLQANARQIASAANRGAAAAQELDQLIAWRGTLEAVLSDLSTKFERLKNQRGITAPGLQKALAEDSALVDFLEYHDQLTAYVVRRDKIVRVALGKSADIAQASEEFRRLIQTPTALTTARDAAGALLRTKLWEPLAPHLSGAKRVLICPDGATCRVPFAALPGSEKGKYLLEEIGVAVIPTPRVLPEMLGKAPSGAAPSFLVVGDVDFDAVPKSLGAKSSEFDERTRLGSKVSWTSLSGTKAELEELETVFAGTAPKARLTALRAGEATEAKICASAGDYTYLHFATHGFFFGKESAPKPKLPPHRLGDVFRDPLTPLGHNPGLASGLVLAGANRPSGEDDGVLTALEVGELDLSKVELAVLSACETGLGENSGNEGVLGLQRAFHLAGARSTVTTLWQIPDDPTRVLMARFYRNLWEKKMGKLDALLEAQRWMLSEGKSHGDVQRGVRRVDLPDAAVVDGRLPPYFWAAFVLSGDWR